jgi:hypothetical protein
VKTAAALAAFVLAASLVSAAETDPPAKSSGLMSPEGKNLYLDRKREAAALAELKKSKEAHKNRKRELPAPDPADAVETVKKKARGVVGPVIFTGMSLTYDVAAETGAPVEMWIDFHKELEVKGVKSIHDIGTGDTVEVFYLEAKDNFKRFFKQIKLVSKAPPVPVEVDEPEGGGEA